MWHQFTLHALTYCRLCKDAGPCRAPLMVPEPRLRYGQSGVEPETPRVPQAGSTLIIRSYQGESTGSHPNSEVKHPWACSVLRWGTTWESQVTNVLPRFVHTTVERYAEPPQDTILSWCLFQIHEQHIENARTCANERSSRSCSPVSDLSGG